MTDLKNVIKGLEKLREYVDSDVYTILSPDSWGIYSELRDLIDKAENDALALLKAQEPITGETSDGYHTFNELYHHRAVLFSVIVANYPDRAWKSKKHHDGTMYNGMFIVGIDTPDGQATYHYDIDPYWDMFDCKVREFAPEWDGHTPAQAIDRIGKLKAQQPRVLTLYEVVKMAVDFQDSMLWFEPKELDDVMWFMAYAQPVGSDETDIHIYEFGNEQPIEAKKYLYGKTWRCWTSRPTDEQREAVKWDE